MSYPEDNGALVISDVLKICQTLSGLLEKGFGPNALNTMLCSSTGTVMITSSGMPVLSSLHLSHPVGHMIVGSVSKHHAEAGDHSKTLVFLLAELTRRIDNRLCVSAMTSMEAQTVERFRLIKGFAELKQNILPNVILPYVLKHSHVTCLTKENIAEQVQELCRDMVRTCVAGKLNQQSAAHVSNLVVELLFGCTRTFSGCLLPTVQWCIDRVDVLCLEVPGQGISSSRIIDGVLIQRDFQHLDSNLESSRMVRFVMLGFVIGGEAEAPAHQPIFQAKSEVQLSAALDWKHTHVEGFLKTLRKEGVTLILSSAKLDTLTIFLCRKLAISCAQMIPDEDMERLSSLARTQIIHSVTDIAEKHVVGTAKYCRPHNLGGRRYIHLGGLAVSEGTSDHLEKQMLLCGPSPGVCHQMKCLVHNAFKCLRAWLNGNRLLNHLRDGEVEQRTRECDRGPGRTGCPDHPHRATRSGEETQASSTSTASGTTKLHCSRDHEHGICTPGGGSIELTIHHVLKTQAPKSISSNLKVSCELLSDALLTIPLGLLRNSYAPQASRMSTAMLLQLTGDLHSQGQVAAGVDAKSGLSLLKDRHVVEPLSTKVSMIYELLDLIQQVLRMDRIVPVSKPLKPLLDLQDCHTGSDNL